LEEDKIEEEPLPDTKKKTKKKSKKKSSSRKTKKTTKNGRKRRQQGIFNFCCQTYRNVLTELKTDFMKLFSDLNRSRGRN